MVQDDGGVPRELDRGGGATMFMELLDSIVVVVLGRLKKKKRLRKFVMVRGVCYR